jgi:hypothetical protein
MTQSDPNARASFCAYLGVCDMFPPCPLTGGSAAASLYLWPLLRLLAETGDGVTITFEDGRVYVTLDGEEAEGDVDEIVSVLLWLCVETDCLQHLNILALYGPED